ncbi:MAG: nucleotidyltransferase [Lachnospiraceae bacterium]|nr:nucleotidyltransferase [Lachnospiraceae bacterium]
MKVAGLVAEYNPFHNGHVHHLSETRRLSGADFVVVVMSGDYVQRGTPAVIDKYERARMALQGGADLVLELPSLFATASAEVFATASVSLLYQLGVVDSIGFGAEYTDLGTLKKIANVLNHEPDSLQRDLRDALRSGLNYPSARALALGSYFGDAIENLDEILDKPNNILAIEYLRAIERLGTSLTPLAVKRWHTDHNSDKVYDNVASATALRSMIYEEDGGIERITPFVPAYTAREFALKLNICTPVRSGDYSELLQYRLFMERDHLQEYMDFSPELGDRVNNILPCCYSFREWAEALKSKTYTHTRVNRALMHLILGMKEEDLKSYQEDDYCMYARVLGFRKDAVALLSEITKNTALPIITKMADAPKQLDKRALKLLGFDIYGSDVYRTIVYNKFGTSLKDDYRAGIIKV